MLSIADLRTLSAARLEDAHTLLSAGRPEGAYYLCGYAVELALKARVCETLRWDGFPETRSEFGHLQSFRTHELAMLLHLSGVEREIVTEMKDDWDKVSTWNPEIRYKLSVVDPELPTPEELVAAVERVLEAL